MSYPVRLTIAQIAATLTKVFVRSLFFNAGHPPLVSLPATHHANRHPFVEPSPTPDLFRSGLWSFVRAFAFRACSHRRENPSICAFPQCFGEVGGIADDDLANWTCLSPKGSEPAGRRSVVMALGADERNYLRGSKLVWAGSRLAGDLLGRLFSGARRRVIKQSEPPPQSPLRTSADYVSGPHRPKRRPRWFHPQAPVVP